MRLRTSVRLLAAGMLCAGALLFGQAAWMRTKAAVAAVLIERALERTLVDGRPHPPWAWADFHPVGRVRVPRLALARPVLSGTSGATLAFGLGQAPGTGTGTVIAGHRDSWAAFLRDVRVGDQVVLEDPLGSRSYRIAEVRVVAPDAVEVLSPTPEDRLTLVTCWPFSGLARARMRVLVACTRVQAVSYSDGDRATRRRCRGSPPPERGRWRAGGTRTPPPSGCRTSS